MQSVVVVVSEIVTCTFQKCIVFTSKLMKLRVSTMDDFVFSFFFIDVAVVLPKWRGITFQEIGAGLRGSSLDLHLHENTAAIEKVSGVFEVMCSGVLCVVHANAERRQASGYTVLCKAR